MQRRRKTKSSDAVVGSGDDAGEHDKMNEESAEAAKPAKIKSMQNPMRRAQEVIATSGSRKMKGTGASSSAASPRIVQSGSVAAARKGKKNRSA